MLVDIESVCLGGQVPFCASADAEIARQPRTQVPRSWRAGTRDKDTMCFIYTSGTTGLPKAAKIWHQNFIQHSFGIRPKMSKEDVIYGSGMPLYHSAAGLVGIAWMMGTGAPYVIRRKFSAQAWLNDVRSCKATWAQYIGELCRYVLATPEQPDDAENSLRMATDSGLRTGTNSSCASV
jgi:acyl-CoA synthetase (AMP-forming)/AMP-acid ligase II